MIINPYYQDDACTIYHGDCRAILPGLAVCNLLVTDPPYGIGHASNHTCPTTTAKWMNSRIDGDLDASLRDGVIGRFSEWACFGSHKVAKPAGTRGVLVWDKGPASGMGDLSFPWKLSWELIFIAGEGWLGSRDEGVIKNKTIVTRASMGRVHPNEKPEELMAYLISKHPAALIVDPFMGSGTTLRAAKDLGRKAIGIEIEEKYCEIAAKRMAQETISFPIANLKLAEARAASQGNLFDSPRELQTTQPQQRHGAGGD